MLAAAYSSDPVLPWNSTGGIKVTDDTLYHEQVCIILVQGLYTFQSKAFLNSCQRD